MPEAVAESARGCGERQFGWETEALNPARSPAGSTKPPTLKEVIGRKQRVQGLQAGQGELSTQAQLCRGQGCRSDLEEHLPKGERKEQSSSAPPLDPQGDLCHGQQVLSLSAMSPLQAGLGSRMQRGRDRDMGYRAKATMFPL